MWTLGIPSIRQNQIKAPYLKAVLGVMDRLVLSDAAWDRIDQRQLGNASARASFSYNRERQRTRRVIGEERRSFSEAEYFSVDRRIGGLAVQKEHIV